MHVVYVTISLIVGNLLIIFYDYFVVEADEWQRNKMIVVWRKVWKSENCERSNELFVFLFALSCNDIHREISKNFGI